MSSTSITYDLSKLEPPLRALCEQWLEESNESLEALSDRLRSLPREVFEPPTHTIPEEPVKRYDKYTVKTVQTYKPTHPGLRVNFNSNAGGDLVADKSFSKGETIGLLTNIYRTKEKTWSSVQYGIEEDENFECASDFRYSNHSCHPNAALNVTGPPNEWSVYALRDIEPEDSVRWDYETTEFLLVSPFDCRRGAHEDEKCRKAITGASQQTLSMLKDEMLGVQPHVFTRKIAQMCKVDVNKPEDVLKALRSLSEALNSSYSSHMPLGTR